MNDTPWEAIATSMVLAGLALGAWVWQDHVRQTQPKPVVTEPWQQITQQLPMPTALDAPSTVTTESLQAVVKANPFSPLRRLAPKSAASEAAAPVKPPTPVFAYKGRVVMGTKQRGILEDAQQKKTFFVQVGQDVAGFHVEDIAEDHVVLVNLQTKETVNVPLASKTAPEPTKPKAPSP